MHNPKSKTPIAYYGGKTGLLAHILPLIPPHEVYTEVFFGGGSVFFAKRPAKNETINDVNDFVINFYEQIVRNFKPLKLLIDSTLCSRSQHVRALEIYRNQDKYDPTHKAWAFWMATNFSFSNKIGGGIKYSNDQSTVVPVSMGNKKRAFTDWLVSRLENAYIENNDWATVLESRNVKKAFHYLDPPYHMADMGHYETKRFGVNWTAADFVKLLDWMTHCKGRFCLSYYDCDEIGYYIQQHGWFKKQVNKRLQAPKIKNRDKTELLVLNYSPSSLIENPLFDL